MNGRYILVTGGAGYIGSHTVVELVNSGYVPVIVDDFRNSSEIIISGIKSLIGYEPIVLKADITNFQAFEEVFKEYKFDGIIHFAAYKAVGESVADPLMYYRNNLIGMINSLELAVKYEVPSFVFSSSCTVYGEPDHISVNESSPTKEASSPYGATKQMCERMLSDLHRSGSPLSIVSLRYFNPVGAHPSAMIGELPLGKPNNLLPYITQTGAGVLEQLTVFGNDYNTPDGTCIRDFIHVVDLAKAHVKSLDFLESKTSCLEVINIGSGIGSSVLDLINSFEKTSGVKLNWKFGPRRSGDVEKIYAEVGKSADLLGWKTEYSIHDAVRDAWSWELKLRNEK